LTVSCFAARLHGMARAPRKPRKAYHHGDLRRALLDAAIDILRDEGAHALTLREVARRVGVTQAAPYHHFADKDAILASVAEEGFAKLSAAMRRARDAAQQKPLPRLRALGEGYVAFATAHPEHFRIMFGAMSSESEKGDAAERCPGLAREAAGAFAILLEAMTAAHEAGLLRKGDPGEFALLSWSMVHGLSMLAVEGQLPGPADVTTDVKGLARQAGDLLVRGLSR
jgi:AcrR family transcriptional regulator